MPRDRRQKAPGFVHHVVHRGINRQAIFREPQDYALYLHALAKSARKNGVHVLAYCLMTNHLHLLLEDAQCRISELMHALNGFYTTEFNKRYQCEGALLRGRFYSKPVFDSRYELLLFRYIHLNPVKAGIVASADHYPWSSYLDYLNRMGRIPVARERLLRKLQEVGIERGKIHAWMCTEHVLMDATCEPEALDAWQRGRARGVASGSCSLRPWRSPLFDVEGWRKHHPESARSLAQEREALLVEACCKVAQRHGVAVHELVASTRRGGAALTRARGMAMLQCKDRHAASYEEMGKLFCLAVRSVANTLTRARGRLGASYGPVY